MKNIYHDQNIYRGELMLRPVEQSDINAIDRDRSGDHDDAGFSEERL